MAEPIVNITTMDKNAPIDEKNVVETVHATTETDEAIQNERQLTLKETFKLYPKAVLFSFIISLAVIMEGYDTNLMGNFYPFPEFKNRFGDEVDPEGGMLISARWQTILGNGSQVGSILGLFLNGIISEKFGYKKTMIISMIAMIGAIFIPFFSNSLEMFLAGAILQGIPWGIFQTLAVTYAADICPTSLRAYMTSWINMCWVIGQLISSGMLRGLLNRHDQWGYRIPFAIQWIWPVPIIIGTLLAPESPWWLVRQNRLEEARNAMLEITSQNTGIPFNVDAHLEMMKVTNQFEIESSTGAHYWDCFRGTNRRRTEIASMVFLTQAFCGIPFMSYSTQFYLRAGLSNEHSYTMSVGQSALGFLGCLITWWFMSKFGRRTLYVTGLSGMFVLLMAIGFCGITDNAASAWAAGTLLIIFLFVFQLSVGPTCYSLVAEIPSTRLRIKTVAFARAAYNTGGFINNALMPQMIGLNAWKWGAKCGFFWAGIDLLFLIYMFLRLPEPKGLTYSDLDLLFEHNINARKFSQETADLLKPALREVAKKGEMEAEIEHVS
ncbi:alpha glucoside transporter [Amylocarpus encephaloides]|uniref:Alpha glucoside transporter n=1 Tax=Amylocarpus encephaloides TaxID=45428 RepID=A0A9P8C2Q6_9HELO|nr:alpha glucoside transporter [Amylocarpus encephaloides]